MQSSGGLEPALDQASEETLPRLVSTRCRTSPSARSCFCCPSASPATGREPGTLVTLPARAAACESRRGTGTPRRAGQRALRPRFHPLRSVPTRRRDRTLRERRRLSKRPERALDAPRVLRSEYGAPRPGPRLRAARPALGTARTRPARQLRPVGPCAYRRREHGGASRARSSSRCSRRRRSRRVAVSRVVGTLRSGWEAWTKRSLAELDVAYLYLDAIRTAACAAPAK